VALPVNWAKIFMAEMRVLIAAAGRGTRAGLPYPKTLHPVRGIPILLRIVELLSTYDKKPTVIVSPAGEAPISDCLRRSGIDAHLVIQAKAKGMGDAVLRFAESPAFEAAEHVLLVWGDIPFIQPSTLAAVVHAHFERGNDFTFATRHVDAAYTVVLRDAAGEVAGVVETREQGIPEPQPGERDIGLFVFRQELILAMLLEELAGKHGKTTGEHGFLYVIGHLVQRGFRVEALPVAEELDLVSLNSLDDLAGVESREM
jgi:bifunctional UDP-N-acetylglucosamine pyrophosphorylase/glucosamine-1-phosphate N-acetyltransferase